MGKTSIISEAKKRFKTVRRSAVALPRHGSPHFCDWCAKNVVENCAHGLDTKFYSVCGRGCVGGREVRGLIVLDGDKSKLLKRIEALIKVTIYLTHLDTVR
jgi:hypothetical protein